MIGRRKRDEMWQEVYVLVGSRGVEKRARMQIEVICETVVIEW